MSSENKKDSSESMGNLKDANVSKNTSSLILNYSKEEQKKAPETTENPTKAEIPAKQIKKKKKNTTGNLSKVNELEEKNKQELKKQVETLKKIKKFLNMEVSTFINIGIQVIIKINKKIFGARIPEKAVAEETEEETDQEVINETFSFKTFMDMNIIFTDNQKKPLYLPAKKDSMYTQNDQILTVATMTKITDVFIETADKLKKVPVPDKGYYKGIPLTEILRNITEDQIYQFLFYVKKFPSKYIGKNYRISESFAAWVMSGTPDS